jgi:hypothetical protein
MASKPFWVAVCFEIWVLGFRSSSTGVLQNPDVPLLSGIELDTRHASKHLLRHWKDGSPDVERMAYPNGTWQPSFLPTSYQPSLDPNLEPAVPTLR